MANFHLRDKNLSLKAVGLLSKMLSFNDGWKFSTRGLSAICKEGPDAILSALRELERHEYVRQEKKQEKPSIRDQLKAAAKSQPEKKAPARARSHDMGLE